MHIEAGDVLILKKPHPCGANQWEVLRIGQDFRIKCTGCGHQLMIGRRVLEKRIKAVRSGREGDAVSG